MRKVGRAPGAQRALSQAGLEEDLRNKQATGTRHCLPSSGGEEPLPPVKKVQLVPDFATVYSPIPQTRSLSPAVFQITTFEAFG